MPKFTITCDVTATVRETWTIDAGSADEARTLFEECPDGQQAEFVGQEVTGDEEDRSIVGIDEAPAIPIQPFTPLSEECSRKGPTMTTWTPSPREAVLITALQQLAQDAIRLAHNPAPPTYGHFLVLARAAEKGIADAATETPTASTPMSEPVKIAIVIQGGCLVDVISDGAPVEYVLIDYDTNTSEPEALMMPQGEGEAPAPALLSIGRAETAGTAGVDVLTAFMVASGEG